MVESPGTAPGSDPRITSAFMSIVPKDNVNIGDRAGDLKRAMADQVRLIASEVAATAASITKNAHFLRV